MSELRGISGFNLKDFKITFLFTRYMDYFRDDINMRGPRRGKK